MSGQIRPRQFNQTLDIIKAIKLLIHQYANITPPTQTTILAFNLELHIDSSQKFQIRHRNLEHNRQIDGALRCSYMEC